MYLRRSVPAYESERSGQMLGNSTNKTNRKVGIETTSQFTLEARVDGDNPADHSFITSRLLVDGIATDTEIVGHSLQHQFKLRNNFLLITNWGRTYEKNIEVNLLDPNYRIVDHRSIKWPDDSVQLESVVVSTHNVFELNFSNGRSYDLKMRLSIANTPSRLARKFALFSGFSTFRSLHLKPK